MSSPLLLLYAIQDLSLGNDATHGGEYLFTSVNLMETVCHRYAKRPVSQGFLDLI